MFFAWALVTLVGFAGMVYTYSQEQDPLPQTPTASDTLTGASLDQNQTGLVYNPSESIRERFVASVDVLIAGHGYSELNPEYAKRALRNTKNNFILYMMRKRGSTMIIVGFAVGCLEVVQGSIFCEIDVLIAEKGSGAPTLFPLLKFNFENFRNLVSRTAERICFYLFSVPNQVDFYEKNGFEKVERMDKDGLKFMGLILQAPAYPAIVN